MFMITLHFLATFQLKNNLLNRKSESAFRNFPNAFFKVHRQWRKVRKVVAEICSQRNAHVLGVKELNIGKLILDMSESLEVCRH